MPNPLDLERVRDYIAKATAGPWHYWHDDDWMAMNCYGVTTDPRANSPEDDHDKFIALTLYQATPLVGAGLHHEDTEFIANSRTDLPAAVAEIERLRAQLERVEAVIKKFDEKLEHARHVAIEDSDDFTDGRHTGYRIMIEDNLKPALRNEQEWK